LEHGVAVPFQRQPDIICLPASLSAGHSGIIVALNAGRSFHLIDGIGTTAQAKRAFMEHQFKNDRVKDLKSISDRHSFREIEGCTSWRHFVVHEDRGWLLNALGKIQNQMEKVQQVSMAPGLDEQVFESELQKLFAMFEQNTLNHLGDTEE
jgi:hypothetical protein